MDYKVEDLSSVKKKLVITVPGEEVTKALDKAYKELKKNAKVKGFRPGKAPRSVLERYYGDDVNADIIQELVGESFTSAVREADLKIIGTPDIDPPKLAKGEDYTYEAVVEIYPEVGDVDLSGMKFTKKDYKASEEEVDHQIEMLRRNMGHLKPLEEERPAKNGDYVIIDYENADEKNPLEGLERTEDFPLELGSGKILKDFDEQLVGMKKDETREIHVAFPEDYSQKNLAGKEADIKVHLKDIREQILPAVDDDLAKDLGEFETLEDLKKAIRENLQAGYDKRSEQDVDEQAYDALLSRVSFEVPDILVDHEVQSMVSDAERAMAYRNMSLEDTGMTKEALAESYKEPAEKQVRRYLLLDRVIEQENIALPDEALEEAYKNMSESLRQPLDMIRSYYDKDKEQQEMLKHTLLQKEALKYIKGKAEIETVAPEDGEEAE